MDIIQLNKDIEIRNQFPSKPNLLTQELIEATGFSIEKALRIQASVCKALTLWLEATNKKFMNLTFSEYYSKCITNNWIRKEDAWLNLEYGFIDGVLKTEFADKFNIKLIGFDTYESFLDWADNQEEYLGTLRIVNAKKTGKHSLMTYKQKTKLFISDISSRGIGKNFYKFINKDNFLYFTTMYI